MAKAIIPNDEHIEYAKTLPMNTHKIVAHCVEYHKAPNGPDTVWWKCIRTRADEAQAYQDAIVAHHIDGWLNPKDAASNMAAYKIIHPTYSFRISRYPLSQHEANRIAEQSIWKAREASRMADGKDGSPSTYEALPWANEDWFKDKHETLNHYAHVSQDKDGMIAYTPDSQYGQADRQKRMSPGRYLSEFFGYELGRLPYFDSGLVSVRGDKITIDPIQHYARLYTKTYGDTCELKFAPTQEEMIEVYQKGPDSCMTFRNNSYCGHMHPVAVYAAGDLHLAYLVQKDGSITARALVWPDKKVIGRTYGDSYSLLSKLFELGYDDPKSSFDAIKGARMLKIGNDDGHGYIMPFLDACGSQYYDGGEFWIMGPSARAGTLFAGNQNGLSNASDLDDETRYDYVCDNCGDGCNETWTVYHARGTRAPAEQSWCESCVDNDAFICAETTHYYSNSVASVTLANNSDRVTQVNLDNYFQCAFNSSWYSNDDCAGVDSDGDKVSADAVRDLHLILEDDAWIEPDPNQLDLPGIATLPLPASDVPEVAYSQDLSDAWTVRRWNGSRYRWAVVAVADTYNIYGERGYLFFHEALATCEMANAVARNAQVAA